MTSLDDEGPGVTPRRVIETIATAVHELGLPHPVHVHCNNLGVSGNWRTTLDTLRTLEGRRAHLAHLQFHAYGGRPGGRPRSRAPELVEHLNAHPELSADVGQVMFGDAMTMTADAPVSAVLREITHGRWVNADTEAETGCGIVPFTYRERNYVHALQWGIGLELFLLGRDPWQLVLSTDHPNGGSFLSYPRLIRLLMDREFRNEQIGRVNKKAMRRTVLLDDLDREYTLEEIAIITRAGPARLLGLRDKGHLGVGADADITIYDDRDDREAMFAAPRHVIKDGRPIVEDGELRDAGRRADLLRVGAEYDPGIERTLEPLFEERYSVRFANYPVREPWLLEPARTVAASPNDEAVMQLHGAEIVDTFAEAFPMWGARVVITAATPAWALEAGRSLTGFATSVIGCKCEAGIERELDADETPDGRPGVSALLFAMDRDGLAKRLVERVGQSVLTCPTTACFNGLDAEDTVDVGGQLRFFGDGYQASKVLDGRRYWRVPGDGGRVPRRGALRRRRGRGRRQHHHPRAGRGAGAARGGGGGERDARRRGRDHAVPGRDRAQRQQGRLALQRAAGVDERRAVPDAARAGRAHRRAARRRLRVRDRHRRAGARTGPRGDGPRAGRRRRGGRRPRDGGQLRRQPRPAPHPSARARADDADAHAARATGRAARGRGAVPRPPRRRQPRGDRGAARVARQRAHASGRVLRGLRAPATTTCASRATCAA